MLGQYFPVRAGVVSVDLSTHADQSELLDWLATGNSPQMVYVNHGEEHAAAALAAEIEHRQHTPAVVAQHGERVRLHAPASVRFSPSLARSV